VDPEAAVARRQVPSLSILLETKTGCLEWTTSASSLFGRIVKIRLSPDGWGLGLLDFEHSFQYASEVVFINWKSGGSKSLYQSQDREVTDVEIAAPTGPIYLAGIERTGKLPQNPVPAKVKILRSPSGVHWAEIGVDYRASARRVIVAAAGPEHVWAATDTGMILKLVQ
ncbi:MAG: hypothetical protein ACRD96_28015, partial [Bryobacteraceae bacterium]